MPIPIEDLDVFCLICEFRLKFPEGVDAIEGNKYDILGWVNNHIICPKCAVCDEYYRNALRVGVNYVKELVKNRDAKKREN